MEEDALPIWVSYNSLARNQSHLASYGGKFPPQIVERSRLIPPKTQKERTLFRSGTPVRCRSKIPRRKNNILVEGSKNIVCMVMQGVNIQKLTPFQVEMEVLIPISVVNARVSLSNLSNCTIGML